MPRSSLEELAQRWVPGAGPVEIHALAAGLVNQSCRVSRAGHWYSLRAAAPDSPALGLDRRWECRVLKTAAAAGLAPAIVCCEPSAALLVANWVNGRAWTAQEVRQPAIVDAVAQLLRRVHSLPIPPQPRVMHPAAWIAHYAEALARRGPTMPPRLAKLRGAADAHLRLLAATRPPDAVLCHGDLHRQNIVIGDRTVLLDWEYAHVADPFWDLAGWIANNDWTQGQADGFAAVYLGRTPNCGETARLSLLEWLYDYVCLMWSEVYLYRRPAPASREIDTRADRIAARLGREPGSRAAQVPAH